MRLLGLAFRFVRRTKRNKHRGQNERSPAAYGGRAGLPAPEPPKSGNTYGAGMRTAPRQSNPARYDACGSNGLPPVFGKEGQAWPRPRIASPGFSSAATA